MKYMKKIKAENFFFEAAGTAIDKREENSCCYCCGA